MVVEKENNSRRGRGSRRCWFRRCAVLLSFFVLLHSFVARPLFTEKSLGRNKKTAAQSQSRVIIAGMFKDNKQVEGIYQIMKESVLHFESHMILLFENDSKNGQTVKQLRAICERDENATCINLMGLQKGSGNLHNFMPNLTDFGESAVSPARFSRMALFRNFCLAMVVRTAYDYFVFVDPDLLEKAWLPKRAEAESIQEYLPDREIGNWGRDAHAWDPKSVLSTVERANNNSKPWSAVCFYGSFGSQLFHYDLLAFRLSKETPIPPAAKQYRPKFSYKDWNDKFSAPKIRNHHSSLKELHEGMFLFRFADHDTFVPVSSCFNGLTVYSIPALRNSGCQYNENSNDCEHVALHQCLMKHYPGSVYLDPKSMVYYDSNSWERGQELSMIAQHQSQSTKLVKATVTPATSEQNRTIVLTGKSGDAKAH